MRTTSNQFEVIQTATTSLGSMIERHVGEALGRKVRVTYDVSEAGRKKADISVLLLDMKRSHSVPREYEQRDGSEQFRNPPIVFVVRYLVSAWAAPPADQGTLGAIMRTFLDNPILEMDPDDEMVVAYATTPTVDLKFVELDEHRLIAEAYKMPLAPSALYTMTLRLQSAKTLPIKRVRERVTDFRNITG